MKLQQLFADDDAVSPVIGVILMVAITVILSAVIATFVLGLGDQVSNTAPQASFTFDYDASNSDLTVTHDGGDSIAGSELFIRGAQDTGAWTTYGTVGSNSQVRAGNSATVSVNSDDTVRVVYEAAEGDNSATLGRWDGPEA